MIVLVCGGRNYSNSDKVDVVLGALNESEPISKLVHGAATGADSLARRWAKSKGIETIGYPARWSEHGRAAGPIRNRQMLDEESPDFVVAFPGGRGTDNMIKQAEDAGIKTIKV